MSTLINAAFYVVRYGNEEARIFWNPIKATFSVFYVVL